jgi:hypothetical protein
MTAFIFAAIYAVVLLIDIADWRGLRSGRYVRRPGSVVVTGLNRVPIMGRFTLWRHCTMRREKRQSASNGKTASHDLVNRCS